MSIHIHQAIEWTGKSGTVYRYYIWPRRSLVDGNPPGNFILVKETEDGVLAPVYIGQADDLNHRSSLSDPKIQECIHAAAVTQLHLHANHLGEKARIDEQADLVARWAPVCNGQEPPPAA
jgi:hypothetical protein